MIIPYLFWDYNKEQHEYVIDVLKQREALANEDIYPGYYDGSLVLPSLTKPLLAFRSISAKYMTKPRLKRRWKFNSALCRTSRYSL